MLNSLRRRVELILGLNFGLKYQVDMSGEVSDQVFINDSSDISGLCRVCLTESKSMVGLHSKLAQKLEKSVSLVLQALNRVIGREISTDEKYPSFICPVCLGILDIAYKFKFQFEHSQKLLNEYFGETQPDGEVIEAVFEIENEEQEEKPPVEIVSNRGKFALKDLIIIEDVEDEKPSFNGFLRNLGTEVSAKFVRKKDDILERDQEESECSVSLKRIDNNTPKEISNDEEVYEIRTLTVPKVLKTVSILPKKERFQCKVCDTAFPNKIMLREHKRSHETGKHLCQLCGHTAKTKSGLYNHNISKHQEKKFECKLCGKKYLYSSNLQVHVNAIHLQEKPYLCTECGKRFSYSNALEYHMRLHTGEKKYLCSYCDKRFTMIGSLKRHIRTHTGVRPYKCHYCEKAFRSKGEVDCHEMTHTGFRPYTCKYCGKGFTKTHNLKVHLMGHPGPHVCDICFKTFIEMTCLKSHLKTVHHLTEDPPEENLLLKIENY